MMITFDGDRHFNFDEITKIERIGNSSVGYRTKVTYPKRLQYYTDEGAEIDCTPEEFSEAINKASQSGVKIFNCFNRKFKMTKEMNLYAFGVRKIKYENEKRYIEDNGNFICLNEFTDALSEKHRTGKMNEYERMTYIGICSVGTTPLFDEIMEIKPKDYQKKFIELMKEKGK